MIFDDNSFSIGRTPLVKLNRMVNGTHATILAKVEGRNPGYSVKCRIGAAMVWDAEQRGILLPGRKLIEPTSGNTGIALACVAAARGYPITLTMPETMSLERPKVMKVLGAKLSAKRKAMLHLALSFWTWRTLVRESGLKQSAAVEAMVQAVSCDAPASTASAG